MGRRRRRRRPPRRRRPRRRGPSGKTGWEALDKWVGDGTGGEAPSAEASAANGAAAEQPRGRAAAGGEPAQGGFMGWLKRVFGGK